MSIQVVAFDADDTLWVNEPYFRATENQFCALFEDFLSPHHTTQELFKTEIKNLELYGYGIKGFMLSMIETALCVTDYHLSAKTVEHILELGKSMLQQPIELLDNVESVLSALQGKYKLVVATKGDLLDQERKLEKSGLAKYFHHIEIMSDKKERDYEKLLRHLDVPPDAFLMIGNSLKSDVLPVLNLGCHGFHIPFHTTWEHEKVEPFEIKNEKFKHLDSLRDVLEFL
jgi:putative hydrolase of the HAD superfamily